MTSGLTPRMAERLTHERAQSYVAFILPLTPEDVLRCEGRHNSATPASREEWRYIQCAQRLAWEYGIERAALILDGSDPATQTDLAAWRSLGTRKATEVRA